MDLHQYGWLDILSIHELSNWDCHWVECGFYGQSLWSVVDMSPERMARKIRDLDRKVHALQGVVALMMVEAGRSPKSPE